MKKHDARQSASLELVALNIRLYAERLRAQHRLRGTGPVPAGRPAPERPADWALIAAGYEAAPGPVVLSRSTSASPLPAARSRWKPATIPMWARPGTSTRWSTRHRRRAFRQRSAGGHAQPRRRPAAANVGGRRDSGRRVRPPSASIRSGRQAAQFTGGDGHVGIEAFVGAGGPRFSSTTSEQLIFFSASASLEQRRRRGCSVSASCVGSLPGGCARRPRLCRACGAHSAPPTLAVGL